MNIDWFLFERQKWALIRLAGKSTTTPAEVDALDGVINLMDAIQDEMMPEPAERECPYCYRTLDDDQPEVCDSDDCPRHELT